MKYTLGKDWKFSSWTTFKKGQVVDVTPEKVEWFEANGYGEKKSKKTKNIKEDGDINKSRD